MKSLIKLAHEISSFCVGMEGNISVKEKNTIYIKASGSKLKDLSIKDIVQYDLSGNQLSNFEKKGSMELTFHLFLQNFQEINFVAHTHPINTVAILCSNKAEQFATQRLFPDQIVFNDIESCLIEYAKPGIELTNKIIAGVDSYKEKFKKLPRLILLKNHGIIACGKTENECIIISEICEKAAKIFLQSYKFSEINFLTSENKKELILDEKEKYRQSLL